jgi:integrase
MDTEHLLGECQEETMKSETSFGIYSRKLKSGKTIFYYWSYLSNGKRIYRTTGTETYEKAVRFCRNLLKTGKLASEKAYTFSQYTEKFFVYEDCPYIKTRLLHGKSYTKGWAQAQRNLLLSRIIPEFGNLDIREIFENRIDIWLLKLKQEGIGIKTLNHLITILRIIFGYAVKSHDIEENPMTNIELFSVKAAEKGILSREELIRLFPDDADKIWRSKMHLALNLTAAMTGMRLGEILALKYEMVQPYFITVAYSWSETDQLKCPKTGKTREIPISENLYLLLHSLNNGREVSDFIFSHGSKPISHKSVYKQYYRALENIGINRQHSKERNLTFHSYRHLFNTMLLESGLAPETIRLLTGHSAGMTARYSHAQLTNIKIFPLQNLCKFKSFSEGSLLLMPDEPLWFPSDVYNQSPKD